MILDPADLERWDQFVPGPVEIIHPSWAHADLSVKRLDKISSWASGNKYYKLKYNIREALANGKKAIISKGGMFSNHLDALAKACHHFSIPCICIVRSYAPDEDNPTIKNLKGLGARIVYKAPGEYVQFDEHHAHAIEPDALFIPEGGANAHGVVGAREIFSELKNEYTHLILAGGTLSTAIGIISAAGPSIRIVIVPAWKGCTPEYLRKSLKQFGIDPECEIDIWPDYHFGGFAKFTPARVKFMKEFTMETGIPLDPVYNSKMMFATRDKFGAGYFSKQDKILALHTGGLQGLEGAYYAAPEVWEEYMQLIKAS